MEENINNLSNQSNKHAVWTELKQQIEEKTFDPEETSFFEAEEGCKIKPEVELKEETDGFVYKADFRGHLQLVSLAQDTRSINGEAENNLSDKELNNSVDSTYNISCSLQAFNEKLNANSNGFDSLHRISEDIKEWPTVQSDQVSWSEYSKCFERSQVYLHLKSLSHNDVEDGFYIKEEPSENVHKDTLPEIYDYASDGIWEAQLENSSQISQGIPNLKLNGKAVLLTQAEKKRLYRMRIKEENPALWSSIKKKEAARKREQREKRRHILYEMQKAMDLSLPTNSPDFINQKLYLEALKERYPELWSQLLSALPSTQGRDEQIYNERSNKSKRHDMKPARMYKDVIEAQKKRLYRQRIKEERPEMYERQKARDAYARSMQRLMQKRKNSENQIQLRLKSIHPNFVENKLNFLQNIQAENYPLASPKPSFDQFIENRNNFHSDSGTGTFCSSPHSIKTLTSTSASESSVENSYPPCKEVKTKHCPQICDNQLLENEYSVMKPVPHSNTDNISDETEELRNVNRNSHPRLTACSKQSDILWYWNDLRGSQLVKELLPPPLLSPWMKGLTEEERLQKILKERLRLKEKRRRYRMNMTPERRKEFLEIERERLKLYRLKKKASEVTAH